MGFGFVKTAIFGGAIALAVPGLAIAQTADAQTLADIRQSLSVVYVEVTRLRRELSTTGAPGGTLGAGNTLDRIDTIEAEIQRLTAAAEALELRVNRVVQDGTNRIGDIEFQLCELDENCDLATYEFGATLGGETGAVAVATPVSTGTELAVGEQADFAAARADLDGGAYAAAIAKLDAFSQSYPGSPLAVEAHFMRGTAHEGQGDTAAAARAYLESFSAAPSGEFAPKSLYKLGASLGILGQNNEACLTLGEVEVRFPESEAVLDARSAMRNLGCS